MDSTIFEVLGTLSPGTNTVRLLTSKTPADFGLKAKKFVKQHSGMAIEVRKTKDFHDRFIILDQTKCHLLGASIKDAGNKSFTIVPLVERTIVHAILSNADQVWSSATPL